MTASEEIENALEDKKSNGQTVAPGSLIPRRVFWRRGILAKLRLQLNSTCKFCIAAR